MSFHLYTGNMVEALAGKLAGEISANPLPVFQDDIVVVQSKGMERWLRMEIARLNGICANISFPFPRTFFYRILSNIIDLPAESLFSPQVMQWKIMKLLPGLIDHPLFENVKSYIRGDNHELKTFQLSGRIAGLFDQYLIYRPDMMIAWENGSPSITGNTHEKWQAELWRELIRNSTDARHPAKLKIEFMEAISKANEVVGFPARVFVFGISTLPPFYMQILKAVSTLTDIHLFYHNPCKEFWQYIQSEKSIARKLYSSDDKEPLYLETGNSLLASMGRVGKDFFELIMNLFQGDTGIENFIEPGDETMLCLIQSDILNLVNSRHQSLPENDRSIEIHCCYSPMREVEALYDNLLSMFDGNRQLRPRDVIVMVPDISLYAPLIKAVFDNPEQEHLFIHYTIADRSLNIANPAAVTLMRILLLDQNRFRATEVLDILAEQSVHKKFGFKEGDLQTVRNWISQAAVRWGIDEAYKKELGMPAFRENTWRFGIDRLIMGYAMSTDEAAGLYTGILPCGEFESDGFTLLGSLSTFLENLFDAVTDMRRAKTLKSWTETVMKLIDGFFIEDDTNRNDIQQIRDLLTEIMETADVSGFDEPVQIDIIRSYIKNMLDSKFAARGFIGRGVTFCTLMPMRSIPFKVVCLMGMNDADYPRKTRRQGFDLMAAANENGDPDKRAEDKYLFLEALLSARKNLIISYVGRNVRDNTEIIPSPLVQELCDYIRRVFGQEQLDAVVKQHPLQPFSAKYFEGGKLFSYSQQNFEAACNIAGERICEGFVAEPVSVFESEEKKVVNAINLVRFFRNPSEFFLKDRLSVHLRLEDNNLCDDEPFELNQLESYSIQDSIVEKLLSGKDIRDGYETMKAGGSLPPGGTGKEVFYNMLCKAGNFSAKVEKYTQGRQAKIFEREVELSALNIKLFVRLENLYPVGQVFFRPATLKAKDILRGWIYHLCLCFCSPDDEVQTIVIGTDEEITFKYVERDGAQTTINELLELHFQGSSKPICFFPETSWAFAKTYYEEKIKTGDEDKAETKALNSALDKWDGFYLQESENEYIRKCFDKLSVKTDGFKNTALSVCLPLLSASGAK